MDITRRDFLVRGAGAVAVAGATAAGAYLLHDPSGAAARHPVAPAQSLRDYFAAIQLPASTPRISVALGGPDRIEQMVRAALQGLDPGQGLRRFITAGDVVLIKPNVGFDRPAHWGATTNPEVLRWVIRLCREAGAGEILITDNPIEAPDVCFAKSGLARVIEAEGARIIYPSTAGFTGVVVNPEPLDRTGGNVLGTWPVLYGPLQRANKVIGLAPIKDHNLCSASMNLKNWYGLLGGRRNQFHQAIHEVISDLATMVSPTLVIADATRVMMRNGPTGGGPGDLRPGGELGREAVVAAVDPVAADAWCYQNLLGRDPAQLPYLEMAERKIAARRGSSPRLGSRAWQAYAQAGLVATVSV